ncbi:unnamed protein product [Cuscuta epithymum]|uniref:Uncharacterized protein n=1 Tax=Cuscuta epithymum TaxID=186058 RepID=A0AAV0C671_9ASTE|nr:unnamed protein product [Cuscuta epithymum]
MQTNTYYTYSKNNKMIGHLLLMLPPLLLSSVAFSSPSPSSSPPVFDVNGDVLMLGKPYYAFSGGTFLHPLGLCLPYNTNGYTAARNDVVQCPFFKEDSRGFPITFSPIKDDDDGDDEKSRIVRENTFYKVQFSIAGKDSGDGEKEDWASKKKRRRFRPAWYLKSGEFPHQMFVAAGPKSISAQFAIKRVRLGYKIVYCVESQSSDRFPTCYWAGFIKNNGYNHLGIGLGALPVQFFFKKENDTCFKDKPCT